MEIKNKVELSIQKEKMECNLQCSNESSLGFIFDSLSEMREYILNRLNEAAKDKQLEDSPKE